MKVFPQTPPEAWRELADEFAPTFWNADGWRIALQTWVIEVDGLTVLVDTGVGNDRDRPTMPPFDHLNTDFLGSLQSAGFDPADVDVVINTHLHSDHVGWNTMRRRRRMGADVSQRPLSDAGSRLPALPSRQRRSDVPHRAPRPKRHGRRAVRTCSRTAFFPSKTRSNCGPTTISSAESLRLRPAPGHTPGASVVWLDAGKPAVFVGDLTHCPMQLHRPNDPCAWDEDFAAAAVTRKRVLTEASRRRAAVIPAHYPGHGGATVVARGDAFMVDDWLELPPI